jgi:hypothetical protein
VRNKGTRQTLACSLSSHPGIKPRVAFRMIPLNRRRRARWTPLVSRARPALASSTGFRVGLLRVWMEPPVSLGVASPPNKEKSRNMALPGMARQRGQWIWKTAPRLGSGSRTGGSGAGRHRRNSPGWSAGRCRGCQRSSAASTLWTASRFCSGWPMCSRWGYGSCSPSLACRPTAAARTTRRTVSLRSLRR